MTNPSPSANRLRSRRSPRLSSSSYGSARRSRRDCRLIATVTVAILTMAAQSVASSSGAQRPTIDCADWQACRQLALDARARGEYERFHDLAWRTVQTGPANDLALLYLLARAQSLSGRPDDALVMLRRLADRGVVTDALTEKDFDRARQLRGWPELEALMNRVATVDAAPSPEPSIAPVPPLRVEPRVGAEVSRFSAAPFVVGGLAYDVASRRLLFGDVLGRRVIVVGEGSDTTADLVRAASAQFQDVTALEIDAKRGDLWVASTAPDGHRGSLHRLQLISGRPLAIVESPSELGAVRLVDLAIAGNGTILVLDSATPRVIGLRAGTKMLTRLMSLDIAAPASIAAADDGRTAYVAHRDGIVRLDLQMQTAAPITAPKGIVLAGFERIRWHRNALVGVQVLPDGSRQIVRLQLNQGRTVASAALLEASLSRDAGPILATVSGDDLYYLVTQQGVSEPPPATGVMNIVVRRIRLD